MLEILLRHPLRSIKLERGNCTKLGQLIQDENNLKKINESLEGLKGNHTSRTMEIQNTILLYNPEISREPLDQDTDITYITKLFALRETVCKYLHLNLDNLSDTDKNIEKLKSCDVRKFNTIKLSAHNPAGEEQAYMKVMHNLLEKLNFLCDKKVNHLMIDLDPNLFTNACGITVDILYGHINNNIINFTDTKSVTAAVSLKHLRYIFGAKTVITNIQKTSNIPYSTITNMHALSNQISYDATTEKDKIQLSPQGSLALDKTLLLLGSETGNEFTAQTILLGALRDAANTPTDYLVEERKTSKAEIKHILEENKWHLSDLKYLILPLISVYAPHQKLFTFKNTALKIVSAILIVVIWFKLVNYKPKPEHQRMQEELIKEITMKLKGEILAFPSSAGKISQQTTKIFTDNRFHTQIRAEEESTTKLKTA